MEDDAGAQRGLIGREHMAGTVVKNAATTRTAKGAPKATKAPAKATPRKPATASSNAMSASARIDRKIASLGDWRGERLAELRALIHEVDPVVVEEWKWMGTPVWSHAGMYALANPHKDKVKLTFFHGAKRSDSGRLFNAGLAGGKWRAIDFR